MKSNKEKIDNLLEFLSSSYSQAKDSIEEIKYLIDNPQKKSILHNQKWFEFWIKSENSYQEYNQEYQIISELLKEDIQFTDENLINIVEKLGFKLIYKIDSGLTKRKDLTGYFDEDVIIHTPSKSVYWNKEGEQITLTKDINNKIKKIELNNSCVVTYFYTEPNQTPNYTIKKIQRNMYFNNNTNRKGRIELRHSQGYCSEQQVITRKSRKDWSYETISERQNINIKKINKEFILNTNRSEIYNLFKDYLTKKTVIKNYDIPYILDQLYSEKESQNKIELLIRTPGILSIEKSLEDIFYNLISTKELTQEKFEELKKITDLDTDRETLLINSSDEKIKKIMAMTDEDKEKITEKTKNFCENVSKIFNFNQTEKNELLYHLNNISKIVIENKNLKKEEERNIDFRNYSSSILLKTHRDYNEKIFPITNYLIKTKEGITTQKIYGFNENEIKKCYEKFIEDYNSEKEVQSFSSAFSEQIIDISQGITFSYTKKAKEWFDKMSLRLFNCHLIRYELIDANRYGVWYDKGKSVSSEKFKNFIEEKMKPKIDNFLNNLYKSWGEEDKKSDYFGANIVDLILNKEDLNLSSEFSPLKYLPSYFESLGKEKLTQWAFEPGINQMTGIQSIISACCFRVDSDRKEQIIKGTIVPFLLNPIEKITERKCEFNSEHMNTMGFYLKMLLTNNYRKFTLTGFEKMIKKIFPLMTDEEFYDYPKACNQGIINMGLILNNKNQIVSDEGKLVTFKSTNEKEINIFDFLDEYKTKNEVIHEIFKDTSSYYEKLNKAGANICHIQNLETVNNIKKNDALINDIQAISLKFETKKDTHENKNKFRF